MDCFRRWRVVDTLKSLKLLPSSFHFLGNSRLKIGWARHLPSTNRYRWQLVVCLLTTMHAFPSIWQGHTWTLIRSMPNLWSMSSPSLEVPLVTEPQLQCVRASRPFVLSFAVFCWDDIRYRKRGATCLTAEVFDPI